MRRLVLASASPRRKELLENLGLKFDIVVSNEEENVDKNLPIDLYVKETALKKAYAVSKVLQDEKNTIIISADTVVGIDGRILEKPKDREDAINMLKSLSGKTHTVYTGICVMRLADAYTIVKCVETNVVFRELSEKIILNYISTNEYTDKAGAYAIQGKGNVLVSGIEGDYNNVVGLSTSELCDMLLTEFDIDIFDKEFSYES